MQKRALTKDTLLNDYKLQKFDILEFFPSGLLMTMIIKDVREFYHAYDRHFSKGINTIEPNWTNGCNWQLELQFYRSISLNLETDFQFIAIYYVSAMS